jgi:thymidylate kinase
MLKELNLQPSLVITLDMSDHLIYEKLEQRRFDPVTNKFHYILSENISSRLREDYCSRGGPRAADRRMA